MALWPAAVAIDHLADRLAGDRPQTPAALKWQPPDRWHLTLAFLGDVAERRVPKVSDRIAGCVAATTSVDEMRLQGAGHFGPILWIGARTGEWLPTLVGKLAGELLPGEPWRRYRPHVTIARMRGEAGGRGGRLPSGIVSGLEGYEGPAWRPDSVTLVASRLGPTPSYEIVGRWALGSG